MWTISKVRRHIAFLPQGKIFTTRDCLTYGLRAAVDQALCRLVKSGEIRRLARGVFVKDYSYQRQFSDFEIAKVKAESFGRRLVLRPGLLTTTFQDLERPGAATLFYTDGSSSQFHINGVRVTLKQAALRQLRLADTTVSDALRALWVLGKSSLSPQVVESATAGFFRLERQQLRTSIRWLPEWLSERFKVSRWEHVPSP